MVDKTSQIPADADDASEEIDEAQRLWDEIAAEEPKSAPAQNGDTDNLATDASAAEDGQTQQTPPSTDGKPKEDLEAQNERLRHSVESGNGRISALTKKVTDLQSKLDRLQNTKKEIETATPSAEVKGRLAKVKEEYSDFSPLVEMAEAQDKRLDQLAANTDADIEDTKGQLRELIEEQRQIFLSEHPDGYQVLASNAAAFKDWIEDQPRQLRDAFKRNEKELVDGQSAALMVAAFKASLQSATDGNAPAPNSTSTLQARRDRQLVGAQSQRSNAPQITSPAPGADDDPQVLWDHFERLDREKNRR